MTYEEREAIFSKEALNNEDIMKLFGVCKTESTNIMMRIKRKTGDRLGVKGKLHVQDYLDYFNIKPKDIQAFFFNSLVLFSTAFLVIMI